MPTGMKIAAGTVYAFPLANGLHGACRVLRVPRGGEDQYARCVLVCATRWIGRPESVLASADARKILKATSGPALYWVEGPPPSFTDAGVLPTTKADLERICRCTAPWEIFLNVVYAAWREENEAEAVVAERGANEIEARRQDRRNLEDVERRDHVDLAGVVPLAKPKAEREPSEVLRAFITAMNRWETESARIAEASGPGVVVRLNRAALDAIFDEFCTPRDRKSGRLGSYSVPPEYDPEREEVVTVTRVGPRRTEIETQRHSGFEQRVRYVLLKTRAGWLIDARKLNGRNAAL